MPRAIRFMETVLRDGQQSQIATRMPIEDMLPILETMDQVGYEAMEVWGGATFDSCLRFLNEDPWERLRTIRAHVKNTRLQMLLRGQNLLGYHNYADDVVASRSPLRWSAPAPTACASRTWRACFSRALPTSS